ncbi:hypothetical protein [Herpetosiphon gulosus]
MAEFVNRKTYVHLREVYQYELQICRLLQPIYESINVPVKRQWRSFPYEDYYPNGDDRHYRTYMPIIDIAVGPFAVYEQMIPWYDQLLQYSSLLITELIAYHASNIRLMHGFYESPTLETLTTYNQNARCFLSIEIEGFNRNPKHILGSIFNASSLGRLGIAVAWNDVQLRRFIGIQQHLNFLSVHKKGFFTTNNVLFILREQLEQAITTFSTHLQG